MQQRGGLAAGAAAVADPPLRAVPSGPPTLVVREGADPGLSGLPLLGDGEERPGGQEVHLVGAEHLHPVGREDPREALAVPHLGEPHLRAVPVRLPLGRREDRPAAGQQHHGAGPREAELCPVAVQEVDDGLVARARAVRVPARPVPGGAEGVEREVAVPHAPDVVQDDATVDVVQGHGVRGGHQVVLPQPVAHVPELPDVVQHEHVPEVQRNDPVDVRREELVADDPRQDRLPRGAERAPPGVPPQVGAEARVRGEVHVVEANATERVRAVGPAGRELLGRLAPAPQAREVAQDEDAQGRGAAPQDAPDSDEARLGPGPEAHHQQDHSRRRARRRRRSRHAGAGAALRDLGHRGEQAVRKEVVGHGKLSVGLQRRRELLADEVGVEPLDDQAAVRCLHDDEELVEVLDAEHGPAYLSAHLPGLVKQRLHAKRRRLPHKGVLDAVDVHDRVAGRGERQHKPRLNAMHVGVSDVLGYDDVEHPDDLGVLVLGHEPRDLARADGAQLPEDGRSDLGGAALAPVLPVARRTAGLLRGPDLRMRAARDEQGQGREALHHGRPSAPGPAGPSPAPRAARGSSA
mmetsp:Transcript_99125/g.314685  ORF Transcript_99125/g.314685 Transcript_99125/m.314685 type:complete len:578 (-) Transcript_99125:393-2126(-)